MANSTQPKIDCPYPGLRPFQQHESAYFFGRDNQIKEIVSRLKKNRFVAVIGGSGSGKSSLVLAGAIPELRADAFQEVGDFWVPVITTPGTNHAQGDSPIRRLAERFCAVLKPLSADETQKRLIDCIRLLKTENGFNELIKLYGRDLSDEHRDGVDLKLVANPVTMDADNPEALLANASVEPDYLVKINFLFLIDQFEELFHPSNEKVKGDCQALVQRIVDHFKQSKCPEEARQSSRLCVAITMRSEHLNDCPRYDDLPDAINAAAYLVKRLNRDEIKEAIVRPVDAFLRYQFRKAVQEARKNQQIPPDEDDWPESIEFAPDLIDRLMFDAEGVVDQQDHADLLPLLQHLLYWIWICAVTRTRESSEKDDSVSFDLPKDILLADLTSALTPKVAEKTVIGESNSEVSRQWRPIKPVELKSVIACSGQEVNALTACLEQRCEWIYNRPDNQLFRSCWDEVFRNLAFKEPNTGTYTQRRVLVDELCQRLNNTSSRKEPLNKDCLKTMLHPWLGDDQFHQYLFWDSSSFTVKVTHESLIRRWKRFRDWIDWKDRQFMEYVQVLEDCARWQLYGRKKTDLIEGVALRRIEDYQLPQALQDAGLTSQFANLLELHRDKLRLIQGKEYLAEFLQKSFRRRTTSFWVKAVAVLVPLPLIVILHLLIDKQFADEQKNLLRGISIAAETQLARQLAPLNESPEQKQIALRNFLAAIGLQIESRLISPYAFINEIYSWDLYANQREIVHKYRLWSAYRTLSALRSTLLGRAWKSKTIGRATGAKSNLEGCNSLDISGSNEYKASLAKFYTTSDRPDYGLLAVTMSESEQAFGSGTQVFWGKKDTQGICHSTVGQRLWWSNPTSHLGFDAYLNYLVEFQPDRTTIIPIDWPIGVKPSEGRPLPTPLQFYLDSKASQDRSEHNQDGRLETLKTEFAEDIQLGDDWFRFFNRSPVKADIGMKDYIKAQTSGNICDSWLSKVSMDDANHHSQAKAWQVEHQAVVYCLIISNSINAQDAYYGDLYEVQSHDDNHLPLISGMYFGGRQPDDVRMDFETGQIFSLLGTDWFVQPWRSDPWVRLASDVYAPPAGAVDSEAKSIYTKFKWHLKDKSFDLDKLVEQAIQSATEKMPLKEKFKTGE